jgi:hypothetical protein
MLTIFKIQNSKSWKSRKMSGRFFRNPEMSENPEIRKCPRELGNPQGIQGFSGFQLLQRMCTRGNSRNFGVFSETIPGFRKEMSGRFPYATKFSQEFPEIQGFSRFSCFTAVTYKMYKNQSILGVFRDRFPDFGNSGIPEIRDTFCAFQNFGDSGNPDPEKPCFHNRSAQQVPGGFRNSEISRISGDLGDTTQIDKKKFRKNRNSDLTLLHFSGAFRVSRVQRCEKSETKTPK